LEGLDPELLAKIVAEVTQKLKNSDSKEDRKGNKHFERVAKQNPKTYDGKEDPIILEEWVRQMEKIFDVVEVPDDKRVSIGAFYLSGQADIWWSTVKTTFQSSNATWSRFSEALRAKFYPLYLQRKKQKEFLTLKQENLSVMEYANRFAELSRFAPEYVATDYMRMQRFEEGLAPYIRNHLAGQPIQSNQELYERAADVERVKNELRMAHSVNPKKRWNEKGNSAEGPLSKKPVMMKSKF